jgi:hypothetical protein
MHHSVKAAGPWEYFVRKVRVGLPQDCWEWTSSVGSHGYGNWCCDLPGFPKLGTAHRRTYALFFEHPGNLQINHRCGNRRCCNPDHLYAGTQKQNHADSVQHGTSSSPPRRQGGQNGFAKLVEYQVVEIKARLGNGEKQKRLAEEFNVSISAIHLIKKGRNWGWLA